MNEFQERLMLDGYIQENIELKNINDKLSSALESSENRLDNTIEYIKKHLEAKSYSNHKYELFDRKYLEEILKMLEGDK